MSRSQRSGMRKKERRQKAKRERQPPLFTWHDSAHQFGKKVKKFGYIGDDKGMCHGVACVAAHAMLLNRVDQFDRDLQRIRQSQPQDGQNQYNERTFLEAVELCHQPSKYPHLFSTYLKHPKIEMPQHPLNSVPLVESTEIASQGGVIAAAKFAGVYDRTELIQCLKLIRAGIEKSPCPAALLLSDEGHIIAVQYNPEEKTWFFVDIRRLPSQRFEYEEDVARAIANSLTPNLKKTVMSALMLVTQQHEAVAKKAFMYTARMRAWKKTQGIDETKNQYLKRWLFIAAFEGCEKEVAFLLAHQVDPNRPILRGDTPLTIATQQGHAGVVKLLLSHGARPNEKSKHVKSPLYNALHTGNDDIAAILRHAGARLKK